MSEISRFLLAIPVIAGLFAVEQRIKKDLYHLPSREKALALGETDTKELLLLVEADKNGRVSRQRFMAFMHAEFSRLEKKRSWVPEEKAQTRPQVAGASRPAAR